MKLRVLHARDYAENGVPDLAVAPVFVRILKHDGAAAIDAEAAALARAVATACGRSVENVHVIYEPPGAGRVAFGGHLAS